MTMTATGAAVRVERREDRVLIASEHRDKELVTQVPGARWDGASGLWHAPLSWATCKVLRGVFGDRLEIGPALTEWASEELRLRVQPALEARAQHDAPGDEALRPYQRVGVRFLTTARHALLADDMGIGKTAQACVALRELRDESAQAVFGEDDVEASEALYPFPALVVCPNGVKRQWRKELVRFYGAELEDRIVVVEGTAAKRRKALRQVADGDALVAVINWENLRNHSRLAPYGSVRLQTCEVCEPGSDRRHASCHRCERELNEIAWGTVIADEIHRARDPKAQQTRALWAVAHQPSVNFRWGLTGTPVDETIDEAWSVMHFVAPDEYPSKTRFIDRYALQSWSPFGGIDVVGIRPETRGEFYAIFDPRFLRRPKSVALPFLPPKVYQERVVPLSPRQRKLYNEVRDEMLARLDEGTLIATDPLSRGTRLKQAASSFLEIQPCERCEGTGTPTGHHEASPHPDPAFAADWCWCAARRDDPVHHVRCRPCAGGGRLYVPKDPSNKIDELERVLEEMPEGERLVVFAVSRRLLELASRRLEKAKVPHVMYTGSQNESQREAAVGAFQRGEARVILVTIAAGGTGLDGLQVASYCVFLQRHDSRIQNQQAEDRLHRMGQDGDSVTIIDVISEGTLEEDKGEMLAAKEGRFQELVRDEEALRRLLAIKP